MKIIDTLFVEAEDENGDVHYVPLASADRHLADFIDKACSKEPGLVPLEKCRRPVSWFAEKK